MSLKDERELPTKRRTYFLPRNKFLAGAATITRFDEIPFAIRHFSLHAHPQQVCQSRPLQHRSLPKLESTATSQSSASLCKISESRTSVGPNVRCTCPQRLQHTSEATVIGPDTCWRKFCTGGPPTYAAIIAADAAARRNRMGGYHEPQEQYTSLRNPNNMRTVSKEDYLLGRGANPRTGVITPGSSIDSQSDETGASLTRGLRPSAKWRQRGDQWVSLDVDEPSPIESPPPHQLISLPKIRRPKTPQRFSQWNSSVPNFKLLNRRPSFKVVDPAVRVERQTTLPRRTGLVPDLYPEDPIKQHVHAPVSQPQVNSEIRRKPVRDVQNQEGFDISTSQATRRHIDAPVTPSRPRRSDNRSSSAPARQRELKSPSDKTDGFLKASDQPRPQIGSPESQLNLQRDKSFQGVRSQTLSNLNQIAKDHQLSNGTNLDKELPSLPMNNDQYPQSRSKTSIRNNDLLQPEGTPTSAACRQQRQRPRMEKQLSVEPIGGNSHIAVMMVPEREAVRDRPLDWSNRWVDAVPNYDNPPESQAIRRTRPQPGDPRPMHHPRHVRRKAVVFNDVFTDPFSVPIMNTSASLPIPNVRRPRHKMHTPFPPQRWPPPTSALPPCPGVAMQDTSALKTAPPDAHPSVGQHYQKIFESLERPQMPSRALGMQQIPRMTALDNIHTMAHTEPHNQSNMMDIKMGNRLGNEATSCITAKKTTGTGILKAEGPHEVSSVIATDTGQHSGPCPVQTSSHAQNASVVQKLSDTDGKAEVGQSRKLSTGSSNAPEVILLSKFPLTTTKATESSSAVTYFTPLPLPETSANILNVEDDLRDHSICCPDCCKLNCHEGCLGHPSPQRSPTKYSNNDGKNALRSSNSSSSLDSLSGVSSKSGGSGERDHKLTFVKSVFRIPFLSKRSESVSPKPSLTSVKEKISQRTAELTVKQNEAGESVVNHRSAIAAAKKAIGFNVSSSPEHGLNQFMVPKQRIKRKGPPEEIKQQNITGTLTPPPTPPLVKASIVVNECRKISRSRPCSENQESLAIQMPQNRTISGASADIHVPSLKNMASLLEILFVVPYEATRMWLQNNPQIIRFGWSALDCGWLMGCIVAATARMLLNTLYIYSKTGKFRVKNADGNKIGPHELIRDSVKSVLILMVFVSLAVILSRIIRIILLPLRLVVSIIQRLVVGGKKTGIV